MGSPADASPFPLKVAPRHLKEPPGTVTVPQGIPHVVRRGQKHPAEQPNTIPGARDPKALKGNRMDSRRPNYTKRASRSTAQAAIILRFRGEPLPPHVPKCSLLKSNILVWAQKEYKRHIFPAL